MKLLHQELTSAIIDAFYTVYNELGYGFLEKVYETALRIELQNRGFDVLQQHPIPVYYDEQVVGEYFADLIVNKKVIIELKAVENLNSQHSAQLLNYLKATNIEVGLLLNFGPEAKFKRKAFSNDRK
jgi:GxxExxY protein